MGVERLSGRLNAPVQGTAADGVKLALTFLRERRGECPGAVLVLVCHDEIVVECDADKAEEAKEWLVQAMRDGMVAVVNVMEPHTSSRWRQAYLRCGVASEGYPGGISSPPSRPQNPL